MAYDPDPLVWIQSRDSVEGMEAIQTIGGQTLGYPQLVICTPSLRGVKAPLVVEKFPDTFMSIDFVEAMTKAKEAVQVVQINRTKRNEDLALKAKQDEEYLLSAKADALKPDIHKIGEDSSRHGDNKEKEKQIRQSRALRVQPEVEVGGVEIRIFSPLGILRRRFPKTGFYQEVYDWLGCNENLPLYFLLEHQATHSLAYPKDNLETQGHVLRLVEKDENKMKEIMRREEVTFRGTMPRTPQQNPVVGTLEEERKEHRKEKKREGERKEDRKGKRKEGETKEDRNKKRQEVKRKEGRKEKQQEGESKEGRKEKRRDGESKEGGKEKRQGESKEGGKEKRQGESKEGGKEKRQRESKEDRKEKKMKLDKGVVIRENEEKNKKAKKVSNKKEVSLTTMPQGDTSDNLKAKEEGGEGSAMNRRKRRRQKEKERKNKISKHE